MRFLLRLGLFLVLLAALVLGGAGWFAHRPLTLPAAEVDFTVDRGHTLRQAARSVAAAGAPVPAEFLYALGRISGRGDRIRAGSYVLHDGITPWEIVAKLEAGEVTLADVLLVEGWTFHQIRTALESHPYLRGDSIGLSEKEILARLGISEPHPEGLFFPDTYRFDRHSSVFAVLEQAHTAMRARLEQAWAQRTPDIPLRSPYELLILASIIEKETGQAAERGLVASVFINRLRIGMRLQTDPTVIYGFGPEFEGRLRRVHLETDHPWNTYTRAGLPPTPIAMPGWHSLSAAARPEASDYLYFVARNDGSSQFSRNLADHNRAVNRYQRGGRSGGG